MAAAVALLVTAPRIWRWWAPWRHELGARAATRAPMRFDWDARADAYLCLCDAVRTRVRGFT